MNLKRLSRDLNKLMKAGKRVYIYEQLTAENVRITKVEYTREVDGILEIAFAVSASKTGAAWFLPEQLHVFIIEDF